MNKLCALLVSCVLLVFTAKASFADSLLDVRAALDLGQYEAVVAQAGRFDTAEAYVLAAEALNAQLLLGQAERKIQTAKKAMKMAKAAFELDPDTKNAQLQYAIAYGFYGRHVSSFTAWRKNLPKKIRTAIDKAALSAPDDPRAHALKGAWHLNLLYKAGGFDVTKRYGANQAEGIAHFETALAQAPDDIIISASFIMLAFVLEPEARAAQTEQSLLAVLAYSPKNATEQLLQTQMRQVYEAFARGEALKRAKAFVDQ